MNKTLFALTALLGACASDSGSSVPLIDGFDPPSPTSDQIQLVIPPIRGIAPGADTLRCTYLDYTTDKDLDIFDYEGYQSKAGGHHTVLYAVSNSQAPNSHECTEDDMLNARYLAGGGADSPGVKLPDGIVTKLPKGKQLMIQSHWINSSDKMVDGQVAFNVSVQTPKPTSINSQLFSATTTTMSLPPGIATAHASCVVQQEMNFFILSGHAHEWATHLAVSATPAGGTASVIWETPWSKELQFNAPLNMYTKEAPFTLHPGDSLDVECTYNNDTGATIDFPREMCVTFGYFFPAENEVDCVDGQWGGAQ